MKVIVTTSANPFHYGHFDLYKEAAKIFKEENVSVAIGKNVNKNIDFNRIIFHLTPYKIKYQVAENTTLADFCQEKNIKYLIRGIRNSVDAEYELKLDFLNKEINPNINTIFFPTRDIFSNVSSTSINELITYKKFNVVKKYMNEDAMYRFFYKRPKFIIFFGKSCIGKSTFLKKYFEGKNIVDIDKILWPIFEQIHGKQKTIEIKEKSKELIYNGKNIKNLIKEYSTEEYWKTLFGHIEKNDLKYNVNGKINLNLEQNEVFLIDFASLGNYWNTIPSHLRGFFYLVKLNNSNSNRDKYVKSKNFEDKINFLDKNYLEPEYYDMEINIDKLDE